MAVLGRDPLGPPVPPPRPNRDGDERKAGHAPGRALLLLIAAVVALAGYAAWAAR